MGGDGGCLTPIRVRIDSIECSLRRGDPKRVGLSSMHNSSTLSVANWAGRRQRKAEAQSSPHLVDGMAVRPAVTHADIERKVVANLPDQSNEAGYGFRLSEFVLIEHLGDRSHGPLRWSLDDHAKK